MTTLAGTPGAPGTADGTGAAVRLNRPNGIAIHSAGNVDVPDTGNNVIRRITSAGLVSTLAGQAGAAGSTDSSGSATRLNQPAWLSISPNGDLFFTSAAGDAVRKLTRASAVTTILCVAAENAAVVPGASPRLRRPAAS